MAVVYSIRYISRPCVSKLMGHFWHYYVRCGKNNAALVKQFNNEFGYIPEEGGDPGDGQEIINRL